MIWIPLLFHAIYGLFITSRGEPNYFTTQYKWSQNRMFSFQRYTGIILFFFLIYHVISTTVYKYITGNPDVIKYAAWNKHLTEYGYVFLIIYAIGVLAAAYHLSYGIWNFCIRWGITISDSAQLRIQKFSLFCFIVLTLLGWAALGGFLLNKQGTPSHTVQSEPQSVSLPQGTVR